MTPQESQEQPFRALLGDMVGRPHPGPERIHQGHTVASEAERRSPPPGEALRSSQPQFVDQGEASTALEGPGELPLEGGAGVATTPRVPRSVHFVRRTPGRVMGDQEQLQIIDGVRFHVVARHLRLRPEWVRAARHHLETLLRTRELLRSFRVEITGSSHHRLGYFEVQVTLEVASLHLTANHFGPRVLPLITYLCDVLRRQLQEQTALWEGRTRPHEGHVHRGSVKFVRIDEGYGFLCDDDGEEVYFHLHAVKSEQPDLLRAGMRVRFGVEEGDKGPQASWVRVDSR